MLIIFKNSFFYSEQHEIANKNDHKLRRSEKKGKNLYILVHMTPLFFFFLHKGFHKLCSLPYLQRMDYKCSLN